MKIEELVSKMPRGEWHYADYMIRKENNLGSGMCPISSIENKPAYDFDKTADRMGMTQAEKDLVTMAADAAPEKIVSDPAWDYSTKIACLLVRSTLIKELLYG